MYINPEYTPGIMVLYPSGTNSTMFTECCQTAICDDQPKCPSCRRDVISHDAKSNHERRHIRWKNATRNWKR